MNDSTCRLLVKLLSNKWDNMKCKGCPRKWVAQVDSLMKQLDLQDKVLDVKVIKNPLIKENVRSLKSVVHA